MAVRGIARFAMALAACLGAPAGAAADDNTQDMSIQNDPLPFKEEERAISYASVGFSRVKSTFENVSEATNFDGTIGLRLPFTWLSVELNGSFTVMPGKNQGGRPCTTIPAEPPSLEDLDGEPERTECRPGEYTRTDNDFQTTNAGVFAALRTPGPLFVIGKYGYRIINSSIPEIQDGDDQAGEAWTAGAGFRWNEGLSGLELTYSDYSSQMEYLALTLAYGFGASPGRGAR